MPGLGVPGLSAVNPELADILQGYKNALDAALMATRLITGTQSSNVRQPASTPQRTDGLEVGCNIHCQSSGLGLDLERSQQTPNVGYHVDSDGGLVQISLEAVDVSHLGGFFVQIVPLGDRSGKKRIFVCSCGCQDAFERVLVVASSSWIC